MGSSGLENVSLKHAVSTRMVLLNCNLNFRRRGMWNARVDLTGQGPACLHEHRMLYVCVAEALEQF